MRRRKPMRQPSRMRPRRCSAWRAVSSTGWRQTLHRATGMKRRGKQKSARRFGSDARHDRGCLSVKRQDRQHIMITLYGIKNCDTMKKARAWLDAHKIAYAFHNYKASGMDRERLETWSRKVGWETLLNRSGTTFRKL